MAGGIPEVRAAAAGREPAVALDRKLRLNLEADTKSEMEMRTAEVLRLIRG